MELTMKRRMIRKSIARINPQFIAFCCWFLGNLLARMVMMIRLSAPKAIWIRVTEKRFSQNNWRLGQTGCRSRHPHTGDSISASKAKPVIDSGGAA